MVGPGLSWAVSDEVSVSAGGYLGVGERPGEIDLEAAESLGLTTEEELLGTIPIHSEFGLVPVMGFASLVAYF